MFAILDELPPLDEHKEPTVALILGFCCGGIGLGFYFRSLIDGIMPVALLFILSISIPGLGTLVGVVFVGLYGYFRAVNSNRRIANH